jgi:hypothetical protein
MAVATNKKTRAIGGSHSASVVLDRDPGPDHDFIGLGPVAISAKVGPVDRERFYKAIRSQGPEEIPHPNDEAGKTSFNVRRRAIDMAKERARMDRRLSHAAFRVFEAVASRCKWKHRYLWLSMEMLSYLAAQNPGNNNVARYVDQAVALGYVADIYVASQWGGRPKRYLTVVCTAADRTGQTLADIAAAAWDSDIRGAIENLEEIADQDAGHGDLRPAKLNGGAIRNLDALPHDAGDSIRNGYASTRSPDVSTRSHDAHTQDLHPTNARGGGGAIRTPLESEGVHRPPSGSHCTPHCPPPPECDMQHQGPAADATDGSGLSPEVYAVHRAWWPGRDAAEADRSLKAHLEALNGDNPTARLEQIIMALKAAHEAGRVREPGKAIAYRVRQANARSSSVFTPSAVGSSRFKPSEELGRVSFGDRVIGADGNDILDAVPGSDPDTVRRHIREVCGRWAGPNGRSKSRQDVVDAVIRLLRSGCASDHPTTTKDAIRVAEPTNGAKDHAAGLAELRKQLAMHATHGRPQSKLPQSQSPTAGSPSQE